MDLPTTHCPPCLLLCTDSGSERALESLRETRQKLSAGTTTVDLRQLRAEYTRLLGAAGDRRSDYTNDVFQAEDGRVLCVTWRGTRCGRGPTVLYLPGNNDYFYQRAFGDAIVSRGYRFLALSFPGHGFTTTVDDLGFSGFSPEQDVLGYIDQVCQRYDAVALHALVGHSIGALVAARYAQSSPRDIGQLVLHSPFTSWDSETRRQVEAADDDWPGDGVVQAGGSPNMASMVEWNKLPFNPSLKDMLVPRLELQWVRVVDKWQTELGSPASGCVRCPVTVFVACSSGQRGTWAPGADTVLDVGLTVAACKKNLPGCTVVRVHGSSHTLDMAALVPGWLGSQRQRG
jgi:pimeloyl-ACP methyl ester carboxylesterase